MSRKFPRLMTRSEQITEENSCTFEPTHKEESDMHDVTKFILEQVNAVKWPEGTIIEVEGSEEQRERMAQEAEEARQYKAYQAATPAQRAAVISTSKDIEVCKGCMEEVRSVGDDGISVCEQCGIVEGETKWISEEEFEAHHGL